MENISTPQTLKTPILTRLPEKLEEDPILIPHLQVPPNVPNNIKHNRNNLLEGVEPVVCVLFVSKQHQHQSIYQEGHFVLVVQSLFDQKQKPKE